MPSAPRFLFLDALRALASILILLHHFAIYPPLSEQAKPLLEPWVGWFQDYARGTQMFFVIGGFVMARSISGKSMHGARLRGFLLSRYGRLGLPYLAAIILAIAACAIGRACCLPESLVGHAPSLSQCVAHVFFLQDLMGFESFSAGLWFVCINVQLSILYAGMLYFRDVLAGTHENPRFDLSIIAGCVLAVASVFFFNRHAEWDSTALYYYAYFFTGVMVHHALRPGGSRWGFGCYMMMLVLGMIYDWRPRMLIALLAGLLIFTAHQSGWMTRWPKNRIIAMLGRMSYSLFLVHFPVLVCVSSGWEWLGWSSPTSSVAGLLVAFFASLVTAMVFHCWIEVPAGKWSRRCPSPKKNINRMEYPSSHRLS